MMSSVAVNRQARELLEGEGAHWHRVLPSNVKPARQEETERMAERPIHDYRPSGNPHHSPTEENNLADQQPGGCENAGPTNPSLLGLLPDLDFDLDLKVAAGSDQRTPRVRWTASDLAQSRVLSIPEPMAILALLGVKKIFTTGRFTNHRGLTLIYTPGLRGAQVIHLPDEAVRALEGRELYRRSIIGCCRVHLVAPTEGLRRDIPAHGLTELEHRLDNYQQGRYALYLEEPQWLAEPVPCTGRGQLWKPDRRTMAATAGQLLERL